MTHIDEVYIWYDAEGDYLEVDFGGPQDGDTAETTNRDVHVKLHEEDNIIGFSVIGVSTLQENATKPFEVELTPTTLNTLRKGKEERSATKPRLNMH